MEEHQQYQNPLISRYASKEMSTNWSPQKKHATWRRLWLALATVEKELGLNISDEQLEEMAAHLDDIDFQMAQEKERELRHDVMSHVHTFGTQCPKAMPIIHLGATSCFVTDNTELIQLRDGMKIIHDRLVKAISVLAEFCKEKREQPTLGFTHFQPAQLTTVGKRGTLWLNDFLMDLQDLRHELTQVPFRGVKGTTGTQASFLALFEGDHDKVLALDKRVAEKMGFDKTVPVCGQTYSRKVDAKIIDILSRIAQSSAKMANDVRLLSHLKEIEEPFGKKQIGSSAMAYKRNPMRSERVCSLARFVCSMPQNTANTHATQWMERTLDDSANRRLSLPQAFLATDAILILVSNIIDGCQVWPHVIRKRIDSELPFMATENIIMAAVKAGGDRQQLHEAIRVHSNEAGRRVKEEGAENDLLERLRQDELFSAIHADLDNLMSPELYIGRAPQQVNEFIESEVKPALETAKADVQTVDGEVFV